MASTPVGWSRMRPAPGWWKRPTWWLIVVTVAGFVLRLVWVRYATRVPVGDHDPGFYYDYAKRLAHGGGYRLANGEPTAYYPVGYPAVLGGLFWLVEHLPVAHNLPLAASYFNLVLGTATIALAGVLARRLISAWVGVVAATLVAFFPNLVLYTAVMLTETLFNFLLVVALLILLWNPIRRGDRGPTTARLVGFGFVLGACVMVRPVALMMLPVLAVAWAVLGGGWRLWLRRVVLVVVPVVAVMTPWIVRNAVVMHDATFATTTGDNLCIGNNPGATGAFQLPDWCFHGFENGHRPEFETERDSVLTDRSVHWILSHPLEQPRLLAWRTFYTFVSDHDGLRAVQSYEADQFLPVKLADTIGSLADGYYFAVLALGVAGLAAMVTRRDGRRVLFLATVVALAIAPWPFFGDPRFHLPVSFLLAVPAAVAIVGLRAVRRWLVPPPPVASPL